MNRKGFTLVELLATVAILGIITTIAVVSITRISGAVRNKQRENKISRIEVAASKYAFDTGQTVIFVDDLIKDGYLDGDNDAGEIVDPIDNRIINCFALTMQKKGSYYVATFIDDSSYITDSGCNTEKLYGDYAGVAISVLKNNVKVNANDWLSGNITLNASSNSLNIDCSTANNCIWTSTSGVRESGSVNKNINASGLEYTTNYIFTYKTLIDGNIKNYTASINIKIDDAPPVITSVMDSGNSTISIIATEHGSGIKEVCINQNSVITNNCEWESVNNNSFTTTEKVSVTGDYYVHIKDNAGNIGHSESVRIIYRG